ncbi:hypothetical protein M0812_05138 [Anaeramoeba flamelloides]|uniref:BTB domain-containing protein n=1 Tax=Anaeramoeba flamelloides TaxID=1746091 RepID=A0AAV8AF37_9EUKA|nr:hypothetical protein M0812_05138 [Anaeramoeba flamelloides]
MTETKNNNEKEDVLKNGCSSGRNDNDCLGFHTQNKGIPEIRFIPFTFKDVACGYKRSIFLVGNKKDPNYYNTIIYKSDEPGTFELEKEVSQISTGCYHCLIKTVDNTVYGLGKSQRGQLGVELQATYKTPTKINFFPNAPFYVKEIFARADSSYLLCSNNDLYICGNVSFGNSANSFQKKDSIVPVLLSSDVETVYTGVYAFFCFFTKTNDNKLYARGNCNNGQLGLGSCQKIVTKNTVVPKIDANEIVGMALGHEFSNIILQKGAGEPTKILGCGSKHNGTGMSGSKWKIIQSLKDKNVVQAESGCWQTLCRTKSNDFWIWGDSYSGPLWNSTIDQFLPKKLNFDLLRGTFNKGIRGFSEYKIHCGIYQNFFYLTENECNDLVKDISDTFDQSQKLFKDLTLVENKLSVHTVFVEKRLNCKSDEILKIIQQEGYNYEQLLDFFKYIYLIKTQNVISISEMLQKFSIDPVEFTKSVTLNNNLLELYNDEDTKDFKLLVYLNDSEDDNEDEEQQFEEIPVHKFILYARSGLFREMFQNVNNRENINELKDYSRKTVETLEILIKFFYTNSIKLTADDDPKLVVEELQDAIEYYQLNQNSSLKSQLLQIKVQHNLL